MLAAFAFAAPLAAQSTDSMRDDLYGIRLAAERFTLFTGCAPVSEWVLWSGEGRDVETMVSTMVGNRLRAAGLFTPGRIDGQPRLQLIRIRPNRPYLEFSKTLTDPATGLTRNAITYQRRLAFSDADDRTQVSDLLDTFIADYLRVNEEAC